MQRPVEHFSCTERARLAPHFTSLQAPVFGLVNLPETVKGALFARYSRYPGTLRRLFLDEFADSLAVPPSTDDSEGSRAAELYERIFVGYGDDSVAQLGGAHVACEWVSNVLTKILQRPRLASYLEQSTRYIAYDAPMPGGGYRYHSEASFGPAYSDAMDFLFRVYSSALPELEAWVGTTWPRAPETSQAAHDRAVKAKALDLLRGLLPAASLSHMGIYASGQAYEQLILHLLAHPLPEARYYGEGLLTALQAVMPSFVARVPRPERGGRWVEHLSNRRAAEQRLVARLGLDRDVEADSRASVTLLDVEGDESKLLSALLFEAAGAGEAAIRTRVEQLDAHERAHALHELVGERENRRHRPGRGFEALRYRFEIVSDYGAFRDLQRHRLLTVQWQALSPDLGAEIPEEVHIAGLGDRYEAALERSQAEYDRLLLEGPPGSAPYALCLGYRIRYVLDLNAREAMHLIELRSGREGHPSYRAVAHEMHRLIAEAHPGVAAAMTHVDPETEPRLERILSEIRTEAKQRAKPS
ncbi:MAG: FAD-dependent thymidylate synthase [Actinomycetota bacterium]|nr:FAD-dependent thymidylate synthase [Actinomycetota bacterium]